MRAFVAMAMVDGEVRTGEFERLVDLVEALGAAGSRGRLLVLLRLLLDGPPFAEDVLEAVAAAPVLSGNGAALMRGLRRVAESDGPVNADERAFETAIAGAVARRRAPVALARVL